MSQEFVFNITGGGPYGMRIKGGLEFSTPIIVDNVSANSKSERAGIKQGDVILEINGSDVTRVVHETAKDLIVAAKTTLNVRVRRGDESPVENKPQSQPPQSAKKYESPNLAKLSNQYEAPKPEPREQTTVPKSSAAQSDFYSNPPPKANILIAGRPTPDDYLTNQEDKKLKIGKFDASNLMEFSTTASAGKCEDCRQSITSQKLLKIGTRVWHPEHFNCMSCKKNIASMGFFEEGQKIYCKECYGDLYSPKCAHCGKPCIEQYLTTNDRSYHSACFTCGRCNCNLSGKSLNFHENKPHCMDCYSDIMSIKCDGCSKPIKPSEQYLEVKNKQYHEQCFRCSVCNDELASKGKYLIRDGKPCCPNH